MFKTVRYCSKYVFAENITLQGVEVVLEWMKFKKYEFLFINTNKNGIFRQY